MVRAPSRTATERKVIIYPYSPDGMSMTLEGTWRRIPGYPEDVLDYASRNPMGDALGKHLEQA